MSRYRTIAQVTIVSAVINVVLAALKIVIGYVGHSQALIADGVHSLSDLATDGLILVTGHMGAQSPDPEHPYGHRRIETIGSIILALIVMLVAVGIAYDAIHHLVHHEHVVPQMPVIIVAIISIIANEALYYYGYHYGKKIRSDLLCTNAWHHRSDSLISVIVLISVIGAMLGVYFLDTIGALLIAALVFRMGFKMTLKNTRELIDSGVDQKTAETLKTAILNVPGVLGIHQLRTRSHSGHIFVDVHIQVAPNISVSEGHYISEQVALTLTQSMEEVNDVTVHIDPENDAQAMLSLHLPNRAHIETQLKTRWQHLIGFNAQQRMVLHYLDGKITIDLYLPLSALTTQDAKKIAADYVAAVHDIPEIANVRIYYA